MANSFESKPSLGLTEFLAAVQAELDADSEESDFKFEVTGATLEVDVLSNLSISLTSPQRLSVYLNRTPEAPIVDEPNVVPTLPASQATPSAAKTKAPNRGEGR